MSSIKSKNFKNLEVEFLNLIKENYPKTSNKIIEAYNFAAKAHDGIKRASGEPYIIHPMSVSKILIENNMDYATIIAGLLHDVVEDTEITLNDIKAKFGETVASLVDGVTKISDFSFNDKKLSEAENMKRLLIAMGNDVRVIFIKLADRLHNMRTIEFLKRDRQIRMAEETKEIFIPIAERIGIRKIRSELQDLVMQCLCPEDYETLKKEYEKKYTNKKEDYTTIQNQVERILKEANIGAEITGWPEHIYSIFKKKNSQGIAKIRGIYFFKVIVPTEMDCYMAMGALHKHFRPLPGQIKDYIAAPKPNGYRSLQSIMIAPDVNVNFQVMLRTKEMDEVCEYGISSLWNDKDADIMFSESIEKFNNLKDIILNDSSNLSSTKDFIDAIKTDLDASSTWVFTPKFKPICLNVNKPTVIDFAYAVSTKIGENATGAIINGKRASLGTELSAGDVVEVVVSETKKSPSRNWLSVVKTSNARNQILAYFKKHHNAKNIEAGKQILLDELKNLNFTLEAVLDCYDEIRGEFSFVSVDDMYSSIGYGAVTVSQIVKYAVSKEEQKRCLEAAPVVIDDPVRFSSITFAKCCAAIPNDKIVGVVYKNGVAIHTVDCKNIKNVPASQIVKAHFKPNLKQKFSVNVKIVADDSIGMAAKLLGQISKLKYNLTKTVVRKANEKECEFDISVDVAGESELKTFIKKIKQIKGVNEVVRDYE